MIPTGKGAEGLAVSPDGSEVWVVNRVESTISIVDTRSLTVAATLDVPPDARRAEISAGGRVLVPHGSPPDSLAQVLSVYDLRRRVLIGRHAMHEGRKGPGGFGITSAANGPSRATARAGRSWQWTWQTSRRLVRSRPASPTPTDWRTRRCACPCWSGDWTAPE